MALIGADRRRLVQQLRIQFDLVRDTSRPRVLAITAPPGVGKTKVVQEFYEVLVRERQSEPRYWPDSIALGAAPTLIARKRVHPRLVRVPARARMDFFWWGIICGEDAAGGRLRALLNERTQFDAHLGAIAKAVAERPTWTAEYAETIAAIAAFFALPNPVPLALKIADLTPHVTKRLIRLGDVVDKRLATRGAREVDLARFARSDSERLADAVVMLSSPSLPIVLVIDDAHYADEATVAFIDQVLKRREGCVLILALAWPSEVQRQRFHSGTFGNWLYSHRDAAGVRWHKMRPLGDADMVALVRLNAPEATSEFATKLIERCGTNPLVTRLALDLPWIRRRLASGDLGGSDADLEKLPTDALDLFRSIWKALDPSTQRTLAVASLAGWRCNEAVFTGLLDRTPESNRSLEYIESEVGWLQRSTAGFVRFTEPALFEVARDARAELFSSSEQEKLRVALVALTRDELHSSLPSDPTALRVLLEALIEQPPHLLGGDMWERCFDLANLDLREKDYANLRRHTDLAIRAFALSHSGAPTPLALEALYARSYVLSGLPAEGLLLTRIALERSRALLGDDAMESVTLLYDCAEAERLAGDFEPALAHALEALAKRTSSLGSDSPETLSSRAQVVEVLRQVGKVTEAARLAEGIAQDRGRILGRDHPDGIRSRGDLAAMLREAGRSRRALKLVDGVIRDSTRILGSEHVDTLDARSNRAVMLADCGEFESAIRESEEVLAAKESRLGARHPLALRELSNLSTYYGNVGRFADARAAAERAVEARAAVLGAEHPHTMNSLGNLSECFRALGDLDNAVTLDRKILRWRVKHLGRDHQDTLYSRNALAESYLASGRLDLAVREARASLRARTRVLGKDHLRTIQSRLCLAEALQASSDNASAQAEARTAFDDARRTLGKRHHETLRAEGLLDLLSGSA